MQLTAIGDEFSNGSADPVAILRSYRERDSSWLRRLNRWFCGNIIDVDTGTVTVFNDRFGLGRLYYQEAPDGSWHFSTQARALLRSMPRAGRLDLRGLAEFVALGCVLQNRTLYKDVHLLPPGSVWTIYNDGRVEKGRYFDPAEWEKQTELDPPEYARKLADVFDCAVRELGQSDAPAGLSLTGGLDSRAVLAWAHAEPGTLPCYTFGGPYRDCADVAIARKLAAACGQPHTTLRIGDDFFDQFDALAERAVTVSDGTMDVSGALELYVNRLAAEIAPVRLTGNYGSEILRYNVALRPRKVDRTLFTPEFLPYLDEAVATYEKERQGHPLSFIAFKQVPWHHYGRFAVERSVLTPRTPFLDNDLVALAYRAPKALREGPELMLDLIAAGNRALGSVRSDRAYRVDGFAPINKVANLWQEFTVRAEYAYDYGMPPWLCRADHALSRLKLERLFLGRHKFYHFRIWYRDRLRHVVEQQLLDGKGSHSDFLNRASVERVAREHLSGTGNHTTAITMLLTLHQIDRVLLTAP